MECSLKYSDKNLKYHLLQQAAQVLPAFLYIFL